MSASADPSPEGALRPSSNASLTDYRVGPVLGAGGSATVSLACLRRPGGFARVVALKRLHPNLARDPAYRALLESEGRLGGKLTSVNVVHVLDLVHDGVEPVLVLEHVEGLPLSTLLDGRPVPPSIACALLVDVLRGLGALHALPEVHLHRDVCPGNVLVGLDGVARLADFGIARAASGTRNTDFGIIKGTLRYMSPEQLADGPLDERSDLFSVAIIAWELLAGRPLFDASDPGVIVRQLLVDPVPPLPASCDVPAALRALVESTLSRAPDDRPSDAKTMQAQLLACASPATASELSAFVAERGAEALGPLGETIARWTASVAEADRAPSAAPTIDLPPAEIAPAHAAHPARRPPSATGLGAAAAAVAALLLSLVALIVFLRPRDLAVSDPRAADPRPLGSSEPLPALSVAAPSASASASAVVPSSSTPAPSALLPPSKRPPKGSGVAPAASPAACDPPYRVDPSGVRTLRPECL